VYRVIQSPVAKLQDPVGEIIWSIKCKYIVWLVTFVQSWYEKNTFPFTYTSLFIGFNCSEWKADILKLFTHFKLNFTLHSTQMSDHVVGTRAWFCIFAITVQSYLLQLTHMLHSDAEWGYGQEPVHIGPQCLL
jgi:hypothetical protein